MMKWNLELKHECEDYLLFRREVEGTYDYPTGVQYVFRFDNGYGASVVKHFGSYGRDEDLWELAVVEFPRDGSETYYLCYSTAITDDVMGWLNDERVREILNEIKKIPNIHKVQ